MTKGQQREKANVYSSVSAATGRKLLQKEMVVQLRNGSRKYRTMPLFERLLTGYFCNTRESARNGGEVDAQFIGNRAKPKALLLERERLRT